MVLQIHYSILTVLLTVLLLYTDALLRIQTPDLPTIPILKIVGCHLGPVVQKSVSLTLG